MMASVSSAILCDFAQVREGLLFVSSGGITRTFRPELPAPLGFMVAVVVEVGFEEVDRAHELVVSIRDVGTAEQVGRVSAGFQIGTSDLEPGESLYVPLPLDIRNHPLKSYGPHDVHVSVNGGPGTQLTFYVKPTPSKPS